MAEVKENVANLEEKKNEKNIVTVPIRQPIEIDGEKIESIKLDFSQMTGADILNIDEQLRTEGKYFDNIFNQRVLLLLTSKAANLKIEDLQKLHVADYLEVTMTTRSFFLKW